MIRVMIVDDHAIVRRGLRLILNDTRDIKVTLEAASGNEALTGIRQSCWDVLMLDIAMPGKSVLDLIKISKSENPAKPILVLSSYPEDQYAIRMLRAGADGYLSKESAPELLVEAIHKLASGGKFVSSSLAEMIVCEMHGDKNDDQSHAKLTDKEFQVLVKFAQGKRISDIAQEFSISSKTASTYRARILKKLNLSTNTELVRYAIQHNLVN